MGGNRQRPLKLRSSQQCLTRQDDLEEGTEPGYRQLQDCCLNPR